MVHVRYLLRRLGRARPRSTAALTLAALAIGGAGWLELPMLATAGGPEPWPEGRVSYFDGSGSTAAVDAAARRWNQSGARVHLVRAPDRAHANVVFVLDRRRLRSSCGVHCLGLSSTIGRPHDGRATVMLNPDIAGAPTALNVWVAMHELGHILGLRHREGTCSLMNAHAYDDTCTFARTAADADALPCGPASGDVAAAARLYGRDAAARPCR
jgi:hypothetical protein